MSAAEKAVRDRLRRRALDRLTVFDDVPDEYELRWFQSHNPGQPIGAYTIKRMFDGRYWSMQYKWVRVRRRYELVRSSVTFRAKRRDAKERAWALHGRSVR